MDDQDLVRKLQGGDAAALRAIYEAHKDHLLTVAAGLLLDRSLAEDALHDVFVAFAGQARQVRVRGSLKAYLAACVANRARDELRRKARGPASAAGLEESASPTRGPLEMASDCEEADRLRAALAELPYEQREAVVLHLQADMTFAELATEQAVSINTVQSRYRYGIDKLRSFLNAGAPL
jgi:RNA polymerase sigma-70 factor, ECF subfamily